MWDYLQGAHTLLVSYLTIPLETFPSLAFISMPNLALGITKGGAFLCLGDHDWDEDFGRRNFDLTHILQRLSELFGEATRLGHPRCGIMLDNLPVFSRYARNSDISMDSILLNPTVRLNELAKAFVRV